ncbi:MAG: terminase small subunit [Clostridiales bacterium]|nr:terminase small subunit [Clostridiales bacterium]MDU6976049.1 terminase small subunit [Clostridiales bacterium]
MELTPKQEKFVQGIVSGLSQREAYKQAYNATNMKETTIDNKAYMLFNKDEIRARYEEIISEYKEESKYNRKQMEEDLIWVKNEAKNSINCEGINKSNGAIFINAIKELANLNELYPDKKQHIEVSGKINNPYEGLTKEQLIALAGDDDG